MNIQPLGNRVFIEALKEENKSGLIISSDKEKPVKGKVVAIGSETKDVKVGDIVLFKKYGPDEIEIDKIKYLVGDEEDILAIINETGL